MLTFKISSKLANFRTCERGGHSSSRHSKPRCPAKCMKCTGAHARWRRRRASVTRWSGAFGGRSGCNRIGPRVSRFRPEPQHVEKIRDVRRFVRRAAGECGSSRSTRNRRSRRSNACNRSCRWISVSQSDGHTTTSDTGRWIVRRAQFCDGRGDRSSAANLNIEHRISSPFGERSTSSFRRFASDTVMPTNLLRQS